MTAKVSTNFPFIVRYSYLMKYSFKNWSMIKLYCLRTQNYEYSSLTINDSIIKKSNFNLKK